MTRRRAILLTRSRSAVLLGEQAPPRVLVTPGRARANSWEDVADLSASFGLVLDPWQEMVLEASMGERTDGKWAAPQVALSAPRQNGKSQLIVARALAGVLLFDERLIVVSAHQADTARETFSKFVEQIESNSALESRLMGGSVRSGVMNAINREAIKFANGATIKFKARTGAGGRGFSSDCLFLDEAQRLSGAAWASINSTMSARNNPQAWLMGTPPTPEDDGEVFTLIRSKALGGKSTSLAYLEWSAEATDDPTLDETRAKANPAWFTRINHEVVNGEYDTYTPERFALERLGIWSSENIARVVEAGVWNALKTTTPPTEGRVTYGVKFSPDGTTMALAACRRPDAGPLHVELIEHRSMSAGLGWLVAWLVERHEKAVQIVIDGKSHAGALHEALRAEKVPERVLWMPTTDQVITAHSMILGAIQSKEITHFAQPGLDGSVALAGKRPIGTNGGWGWKPLADGDVTPIEAVTFAHWGAMTSKRRPGRKVTRRVLA
ncbi:MAG: terminase large subunit domain-containing protein [Rhodoglobus sp.]